MAWVAPAVQAAVAVYSGIKGAKAGGAAARAVHAQQHEAKVWENRALQETSPLALKKRSESLGFYGLLPDVPYSELTGKQKKLFDQQQMQKTLSETLPAGSRAQRKAANRSASLGTTLTSEQHPLPSVSGPAGVASMPGGLSPGAHGGVGAYMHGGNGAAGNPGVPTQTATPTTEGAPAPPVKRGHRAGRRTRRAAKRAAQEKLRAAQGTKPSATPGTYPGEWLMAHMMNFLKNPGQLSPVTYERAQEQANVNQNIGNSMLAGEGAGVGIDPRSPAARAEGAGIALNAMKERNEAARDYSLASENMRRSDVQNAMQMFQTMLGDTTGIQENRAASEGSFAQSMLGASPAPAPGNPMGAALAGIDWSKLIGSFQQPKPTGAASSAPTSPGTPGGGGVAPPAKG